MTDRGWKWTLASICAYLVTLLIVTWLLTCHALNAGRPETRIEHSSR